MDIERRYYPVDLKIEQRGEKKSKNIIGHTAVFSQWSEDLGGFIEQVAPGAFARAIREDDIRALWNHNDDIVLGRNRAGTLKLSEDDRGLIHDINPPAWAGNYVETIERGDVNQASFGFMTLKDEWDHSGDISKRTLVDVKLFDVSPVTYPAFPQTDVGVRSLMLGFKGVLDTDALAGIFFRSKTGQELNEKDLLLIRSTIERLQSYIPEQAPDKSGSGRIDILRKRLLLVEKAS